MDEDNMLLHPQAMSNFVETEYVRNITYRALNYIKAGYAVHFRGPAGTGKTTIAKHVASKLGQPMVWIHGDEEFTTTSLIGGEQGYRSRKVVDNYISSVLKKEEDFVRYWVDNRLTIACRNGFTMLYDEFTRSRPEANNILLSILEDRILNLPQAPPNEDPYMQVHPNFTAIFTSNPEEYAGVHKTQDALLDRMITIDLHYFDYETEVAIVHQKSELGFAKAELIVRIIRSLRHRDEEGENQDTDSATQPKRVTKEENQTTNTDTELKNEVEKGNKNPLFYFDSSPQLRSEVVREEQELNAETSPESEIDFSASIRAGVMIAKIMKTMKIQLSEDTGLFVDICQDVLGSGTTRSSKPQHKRQTEKRIREAIDHHLASFFSRSANSTHVNENHKLKDTLNH